MKNFWVIFSVTLAMVFWGITFVLYKYAIESFRPISIIFIRLSISIPFLFGFALLSRRFMKVKREDFKWFFLMSFFEPFIYFLGETFGITLVTSTMAAIIVATIPLFVPVIAYFLVNERLSVTNILGLLISFMGVIMVIAASEGKFAGNIKGIMLMFVAVFGAVGYTIVAKKLVHKYNGIIITAWQSSLGALMFLPFFLIFEIKPLQQSQILAESWWAILFLGIFGSGICFILFTYGIRELGASKANVFANLVPVVTAITSYFLLKEAMPILKLSGIGVVLAGLFLSQLNSKNGQNGRKKWKKWFSIPRV